MPSPSPGAAPAAPAFAASKRAGINARALASVSMQAPCAAPAPTRWRARSLRRALWRRDVDLREGGHGEGGQAAVAEDDGRDDAAFIPTWASGQTPVTSPIAHSPPRRASTHRRGRHGGRPRSRRFEPDGVDTRAPAGGDAHKAAAHLAAVAQLQDLVPALAARRAHAHPADEINAVGAQEPTDAACPRVAGLRASSGGR